MNINELRDYLDVLLGLGSIEPESEVIFSIDGKAIYEIDTLQLNIGDDGIRPLRINLR